MNGKFLHNLIRSFTRIDMIVMIVLSLVILWLNVYAGIAAFLGIAGYSLAGLFALYAAYRCAAFDRIASISGSLWFPDFMEYALSHEMPKRPEKLYLSLGDREACTKNSLLKTVQTNTETLAGHYRDLGCAVTWELNPGNHFRDAALRSAKGIRSILEQGVIAG